MNMKIKKVTYFSSFSIIANLMNFVGDLPTEKVKWANYLHSMYINIDKALKKVVCFENKMQIITLQLFDFYDRFSKNKEIKILTSKQAIKCYRFSKACTALIGYCFALSEPKWLSYFYKYEVNHSYKVLSKLWDVWQECAEQFNFPSFIFKESLMYAHCQDLIKIQAILSSNLVNVSNKYKNVITYKIDEINDMLNASGNKLDNSSNQYILKHDDWTIIKENIGSGGYAFVHLAKMKSTGQLVAVKEMKSLQLQGLRVKYMKREIDSLMKLKHPNVIQFIGVTLSPPFCIVTKYMPNGALASLIHGEKISPKSTPIFRSKVMLDIARGMEYIHKVGLIHRDLKPPNVLLDDNDRGIICDFGLSRMMAPVMSCELGTMQWVAPELLTAGNTYNQSVDVYAFGITLWELITSENPFSGMRQMQIVNTVLRYDERPKIPDSISKELKELTEKCWSKNPDERPTFHQIRTYLESGNYLLPGTDKDEFMAYVNSTKSEHYEALISVEDQVSNAQKSFDLLKTKSPYDFNANIYLQDALNDKSLINDDIIDKLVIMASLNESSQNAKKAIDVILSKSNTDFDTVAVSLSKLFGRDPEYVISKMKQINSKINDKQWVVSSFFKDNTSQSPQHIDYLESILSKDIIHQIFNNLDEKYVPIMLKKLTKKFGFCEEIIKSSFTSFKYLHEILNLLQDNNQINLISHKLYEKGDIKRVLKIIKHRKWHKREEEIMDILQYFGDSMKISYPGSASAEILKYSCKFDSSTQYIKDNNFWNLISLLLLSNKEEIVEMVYDVLMKLQIPDDYSGIIFRNIVECYSRTRNDKFFKFILQSISNRKGYDLTKFISACLSFITKNQSKNIDFMKSIVGINFNEHKLYFTREFSENFQDALMNNDYNIQIAVGIIVLKNMQFNESFSQIIQPILKFLYSNNPPFSVASLFFEIILKSITDSDIIRLLVKYNFVLYLHNMPLLYPRENYVPNIITQFAEAFKNYSGAF